MLKADAFGGRIRCEFTEGGLVSKTAAYLGGNGPYAIWNAVGISQHCMTQSLSREGQLIENHVQPCRAIAKALDTVLVSVQIQAAPDNYHQTFDDPSFDNCARICRILSVDGASEAGADRACGFAVQHQLGACRSVA